MCMCMRPIYHVHTDMPDACTSPARPPTEQVEVHGLLRERLLSGKEALGGALTAARRAYEAVGSEDA